MEDQKSFWNKFKSSLLFKLLLGILALILFIVIMNDVVMPYYVRLGEEVELNDVVELPVAEAAQKLKDNGFIPVISDSVYDEDYPEGTIVEQMPQPYTVVKKGRHVYLTVSAGEKPILMPNLFYKSPRDAELILKSYGLKPGYKQYEYSDIALSGVVISQSYPPGQEVKKDTRVNFTISLGPFPKQKKMPDLAGKSLNAAKKQLRLLGVKHITVEYVEKENILPETVVGQNAKRGTPVTDSLQVRLLVSKIKNPEER